MTESCLHCTYWQPTGDIVEILRTGGKCALSDKNSKQIDTCWAWKVLSPRQMERRKQLGLVEEIEDE